MYVTAKTETSTAGVISIHMYADDTRLYVHCSPNRTTAAVSQLELCLARDDK